MSVHLTEHAPGCTGLSLGNAQRWKAFWNRPVDRVLRGTLTRLRRAPAEVRLAAGAEPNEIEIQAVAGDGPAFVPLAIVWDGATRAELDAALDALRRTGWAPANLNPGAAR